MPGGSFLLASPKKKSALASMGTPTPTSSSHNIRPSQTLSPSPNNNILFNSNNNNNNKNKSSTTFSPPPPPRFSTPSTPLNGRNHQVPSNTNTINKTSSSSAFSNGGPKITNTTNSTTTTTPKSSAHPNHPNHSITTPKSKLIKGSTPTTHSGVLISTSPTSTKCLSNSALSSNARNAENYFEAVTHFLSANFQQAIQVLKEQPSKNLLTKLLSARCYHHMDEPKTSLAILMKLCHENTSVYSNSTTLNDVYVRSVLACAQICIMTCQLILFKILPRRFKLKALLPEELEMVRDSGQSNNDTSTKNGNYHNSLPLSVEKDYCHEYFENCTLLLVKAQRLLTLLKKHKIRTEQVFDVPLLPFSGSSGHNSLDAEIVTDQSLSKQIKTLKNHISFLGAIIHLRRYEYDYSQTHLSQCKNLLEKLEKKHTFLHTDMYVTLSRVCYIEEDYEQAHYYINKAERARTLFRDLLKTEVGALTGEPVMLLLDSSYHFDMFDHIQDLSSKILLSKYFEYRIVKRCEDKERLLDTLDDINLKRRQHDRRLHSSERFDRTKEFYAKLRKTVFKKYDASLLEEMTSWGLFSLVVKLAEILLEREEKQEHLQQGSEDDNGSNHDCENSSPPISSPGGHSSGSTSTSSTNGSSNCGNYVRAVNNVDNTVHTKHTYIFCLIKGLYLCKRFDKCLSTFVKYEKILVDNSNNSNNTIIVKIYNWIVDSYVALNINGYCPQLLTLKRIQEMVKFNLPHWKQHPEVLHVAIRFYKFLKQDELAATLRGRLLRAVYDEIHGGTSATSSSSICSSGSNMSNNTDANGSIVKYSHLCCQEFFEELLNTYLNRKVILLEGSSNNNNSTLTINVNDETISSRSTTTARKSNTNFSKQPSSSFTTPLNPIQFDDDLTLYSSFEDFAPKRAQLEKQKQRQALEELKRKREEQQASSVASKKNKL